MRFDFCPLDAEYSLSTAPNCLGTVWILSSLIHALTSFPGVLLYGLAKLFAKLCLGVQEECWEGWFTVSLLTEEECSSGLIPLCKRKCLLFPINLVLVWPESL